MSHLPRIIVFAKAPVAGTVKTRLAATLGDAAALAFYEKTLARTLSMLSTQAWRLELAVTPDDSARDDGLWRVNGQNISCHPQGTGDLGARMLRFLGEATRAVPVIIVGADIPELTAEGVGKAFAALARHDLVFGPAEDGGFWLVGARTAPPSTLFDSVSWSSAGTLRETLRNTTGLHVAMADTLADIDTAEDYEALRARRPDLV